MEEDTSEKPVEVDEEQENLESNKSEESDSLQENTTNVSTLHSKSFIQFQTCLVNLNNTMRKLDITTFTTNIITVQAFDNASVSASTTTSDDAQLINDKDNPDANSEVFFTVLSTSYLQITVVDLSFV